MAIDITELEYDPTCDNCDEDCQVPGCRALVALGPCDFMATGVADFSDFTNFKDLNDFSFTPSQATSLKPVVGSCYQRTVLGPFTWAAETSFDYCRDDEVKCLAMSWGCIMGFMMMPDGSLYEPSLPADQQRGIIYGQVRVGAGPWTFPPEAQQTYSAPLTGHGRLYHHNLCKGGTIINAKSLADAINDNKGPVLDKSQ